jgi:hypothetical protein
LQCNVKNINQGNGGIEYDERMKQRGSWKIFEEKNKFSLGKIGTRNQANGEDLQAAAAS